MGMWVLTEERLAGFAGWLGERERSENTRRYYLRVVRELMVFAAGKALTKRKVIEFKGRLIQRGYAAGTVNTYLSALDSFFDYAGRPKLKVKHLKIQRKVYASPEEVLEQKEYERILASAGPRMKLLLETMAGTGIRVSELQFFTVEAVTRGNVTVTNKGKTREVLLPSALKKKLLRYAKEQGILSGPIFRTRAGKPLSRGYIWAELKKLARKAGVAESKVFPHNLRKLFARAFYKVKKDIAELADVLGHSSVNTTRIYLLTTAAEHRRGMDRMGLVT